MLLLADIFHSDVSSNNILYLRRAKYYVSHIFSNLKANLKQEATCSQHGLRITFSFNLLFVSSVDTIICHKL